MVLQEDLAISPAVSTAIGGLSGVIEVLLQQPLIAWKNAIQVGQKRPNYKRNFMKNERNTLYYWQPICTESGCDEKSGNQL